MSGHFFDLQRFDNIVNSTANTLVSGTSGNDSILNLSRNLVTIDADAGNDYIWNSGNSVTIDAGAGNDSVYNSGSSVTIDAGNGNDSISLGSYAEHTLIKYIAGDGNDKIYGFKNSDSLNISGTFSASYNSSNNTLVFKVGSTSKITLKKFTATSFNINGETYKISGSKLVKDGSSSGGGSSSSKLVTLTEGNDTYSNSVSGATINALSGNDSIENNVSSVIIAGGAGNDSIDNYGHNVSITGGFGDDSIYSYYGDSVSFIGGAGNDSIHNYGGHSVTVDSGAGNDYIFNEVGHLSKIIGGAGNDEIYNSGTNVTIDAGAGNDYIDNIDGNGWEGKNILFKYNAGDGNDRIVGFNETSTLSIGGGSYSTTKSGNNIIVSVGGGKITLSGAANLSKVNIKGTKTSTEKNSWRLNGTTATYGTTSNTLITVKGVKSLDGISLKNKVVTVAAFALNKSKVTLSGEGYKLALASDVSTTATTSNAWSYKNSVATLSRTKGAYYSLAGNGKSISYNAAAGKALAKISGVKSSDGLSVKKKVITVAASSLNQSNVTLSGSGYTLKLASDVSTTAATSNAWSCKNSVATLSRTKGAYYSLAGNGKSISYNAAAGKALAKISGVKSASGLKVSGNVITVPNSIVKSNRKVAVNGGGNYGFKFVAKKTLITGSAKADTITSGGANTTINAGKGNDQINLSTAANNVIVYSSGDGKDTITNYSEDDTIRIKSGAATATTNGNDVVFTVGKGSILLKGAADKTVSYIESGTKKTFSATSSEPYTVKGAGITLASSYNDTLFDVKNITNGENIVTIDASAVTHKLKIKGNELANKIIGGSAGGTLDGGKGTVNDTLIGGKGADVFIYYEGDGNDVIGGYDEKDTITIEEGVAGTIKPSREDVVFQVGDGKITVQDVKGTHISFVEDGIEYGCLDGKRTLTISKTKNDTIATLSKNYRKDSFDVTAIGNEDVGNSITKIYATNVSRTLKITGNDRANQILGSSTKANTITGGGGDDTLQGGSGADVFVYAAGDGNDSIIGCDKSDKISVTSGTVDNVTVNSDNAVVLTIGAGKIILDNAGGKKFTYYDANHAEGFSSIAGAYSTANVAESWFVADDDNFDTGNNFSALVQSNAADCSFAEIQTSLPSANALQTLTYAKKK